MPTDVVNAAALAGSSDSLSLIALFFRADIIVKVVILALLMSSIWSWAIIVDKFLRMRRLGGDADRFEDQFWSGGSLEELYERVGAQPTDPITLLFASAMREWRRSTKRGGPMEHGLQTGLQARIGQVMSLTMSREMERVERYMGFLATVGSTAPFVGLFGTVWGIMNSFESIAATKNTSLAVVAPGIAEALFATALGLVAAIPAVVAYNKFSADIGRYGARLEAFAAEFSAILSRQMEEEVAV